MSTEPSSSIVSEPNAQPPRWAMTHLPSHLRLWIITSLGLAFDLWTKDWAFRTLHAADDRELIKNVCSFKLSLNPGALFGLGEGAAPIFVGASVLALLFVLYLFAQSPVSNRSMHIALGLVLAGALGNLYDRTTQHAYIYYIGPDRLIGARVAENDATITLGDFPTGANPIVRPKSADTRSGMQPVVRDFIKIELHIGKIQIWPWIFNIADALLVVGVAILLLHFWTERRHVEAPAIATDAI